jgi:phospholipid/cholesterol/gamma-HCH transport system ATP-binding protein
MVRDPSAPNSAPAVISVRGLHKSFGDLVVLRGVDLEVHKAENVVVLGKSGSGKSVLIKIIVGLLRPDAGRTDVFGQHIQSLRPRQLDALRVRVGFSFQHSALYDSMDVGTNLAFPLRMNHPKLAASEVDGRVEEMLRAVGLLHTRAQMPSQLSGGQRKRIGIARTLILAPEVMLYDEPTAGLDPTTSAEINDLIEQVQAQYHTTSIIITHDLTCAKHTADRVAMLIDGRLERVGSFDEVFDTPDPRVKAFYDYNFTRESAHNRAVHQEQRETS